MSRFNQRKRRDALTVVAVVEDEELAPAELVDECEHDVTEAHRRPGGQRVASSVGARLQRAGGARRAVVAALYVQVWDVHGVSEGLQGARRGASGRRHQRQDTLRHQLTRCREKDRERERNQSYRIRRSTSEYAEDTAN